MQLPEDFNRVQDGVIVIALWLGVLFLLVSLVFLVLNCFK